MNVKNAGTFLCAVLLGIALGACAVPDKKPQAVPVTSALLAGTQWTAFTVDGLAEVVGPKPKLRWDLSERVSGTGGCNAFGGPSVFGPDSLRMGPLAPVGKSCITLPGGQEDLFFKALERTRKARVEHDQLILMDATGNQLARLLLTP